MIKTLQKIGAEGTYLNILKATYSKPICNVISPKTKNKTILLTFVSFINIRSEVLATVIIKEKEINGTQIQRS